MIGDIENHVIILFIFIIKYRYFFYFNPIVFTKILKISKNFGRVWFMLIQIKLNFFIYQILFFYGHHEYFWEFLLSEFNEFLNIFIFIFLRDPINLFVIFLKFENLWMVVLIQSSNQSLLIDENMISVFDYQLKSDHFFFKINYRTNFRINFFHFSSFLFTFLQQYSFIIRTILGPFLYH